MEHTITCWCCAACGKSEDGDRKLKTCTACRSVKYCNVDCQRNHRKAHKVYCKRMGKASKGLDKMKELYSAYSDILDGSNRQEYDEDLFKPIPPTEDCPLCSVPMPLHFGGYSYHSCCAMKSCNGCHMKNVAMTNVKNRKRASKNAHVAFTSCAFCRKTDNISDAEMVRRTECNAERNDDVAFVDLGQYYFEGTFGVQKDEKKGLDLLHRAVELGSGYGCLVLGNMYWNRDQYRDSSIVPDESKYRHYLQLGAKRGNIEARFALGHFELTKGNYRLASKHFMIGAAAGHEISMKYVCTGLKSGFLNEDEFNATKLAHQKSKDRMWSFERKMYNKWEEAGWDKTALTQAEWDELCGIRRKKK